MYGATPESMLKTRVRSISRIVGKVGYFESFEYTIAKPVNLDGGDITSYGETMMS